MNKKETIKILVDEHNEDENYLKTMETEDLKTLLDNYEDTSIIHPNETYEEFMDHSSFD